jgi:hypothetical protein
MQEVGKWNCKSNKNEHLESKNEYVIYVVCISQYVVYAFVEYITNDWLVLV